jgi:hypothetical protein
MMASQGVDLLYWKIVDVPNVIECMTAFPLPSVLIVKLIDIPPVYKGFPEMMVPVTVLPAIFSLLSV